jgi:Arsenical resistance operon protein ArsD
MKSIQIFEPSLCCSTGVCGVDVDQALVTFAGDLHWAKQHGLAIDRVNLAQQPQAFAETEAVRGLLERSGEASLPVTLVDGQVVLAGRYPTRSDLAQWADVRQLAIAEPAVGCCGGTSRC